MDGQSPLVQLPTIWNLSDSGTKPLSGKRMEMLLHCMGMARDEGNQTVGQEESHFQLQKYSGNKQVEALARNIARVIVSMGLEPLQAAALVMDDDGFPGINPQCNIEPNTQQGYSWTFIFLCGALMMSFLALLGWFTSELMIHTH